MGALLAIFAPAKALLGAISPKVWLAIAVVAAMLWMAHSTRVAREALHKAETAAAVEEAQALRVTVVETERRVLAHQEIASEAQAKAQANARAAAAARATADRVRVAAAAYAASAAAADPSAAGSCAAAEQVADLFAVLLGRAATRAGELADLADRSRTAGEACEAAYDALRLPHAETLQ